MCEPAHSDRSRYLLFLIYMLEPFPEVKRLLRSSYPRLTKNYSLKTSFILVW